MAQFVLNTLTLSNINRFSKFFHCQNQEKICNNIITNDPITPQVCRYTTLWNVRKSWFRLPLVCQEWGRLASSSSSQESFLAHPVYDADRPSPCNLWTWLPCKWIVFHAYLRQKWIDRFTSNYDQNDHRPIRHVYLLIGLHFIIIIANVSFFCDMYL